MSTFKEDTKYVGMAYTDKKNTTPSQIEEYIRKDALLEWAKDLDECGASLISLDTLIDKLNQD